MRQDEYEARLKITAERIYYFRKFNQLDGEEETDYALAQEYHDLADKEPGYSFRGFCDTMFGDELEDLKGTNENL